MIKHVVVCDFCGNPVPVKVVQTPLGPLEVAEVGKTREWDTSSIFSHLCKTCAIKINYEILKTKSEILNNYKKGESQK